MTALCSQLLVTALVVSVANPVLAQPLLPPLPVPSTTGTLPPAPAPSAREWSGESGSSGHPLMTADAIRAAAANFGTCLENLWPQAQRRGVSRASFDTHTRGLTPDLRIMDLMDAQPEFTKSIWDYLDILVNDARIQKGREILAKHRADLRGGGESLWGRPPLHCVDLGGRIEFRHSDRRALGAAFDRDARLRRTPPGLFPRRVPCRAGNPASRRRAARTPQGVLGGRLRADPVHADLVQALRRRLRRRRPPQRGGTRSRT